MIAKFDARGHLLSSYYEMEQLSKNIHDFLALNWQQPSPMIIALVSDQTCLSAPLKRGRRRKKTFFGELSPLSHKMSNKCQTLSVALFLFATVTSIFSLSSAISVAA